MKDCWICKQKAEWRREKLNIAIEQAKKQANEQQKILAIWKEGCEYKVGDPGDATGQVIQYISQHQ